MRICVLCDGYPSLGRPEFIFVEQLVEMFVKRGIKVYVIAPQSITKSIIRRLPLLPKKTRKILSNGRSYLIFRPYSFSFGNLRLMHGIAQYINMLVVNNAVKKIHKNSLVFYGHFLHNAYYLSSIARKNNCPLFAACGEGDNALEDLAMFLNQKQMKTFSSLINGVISVSTENKHKCIKLGFTTKEKIIVLPNGVDSTLFFPHDKEKCRLKLKISQDDFVVVFLGAFIHRKGSFRLAQAINQLGDPSIKSMFIGTPLVGDDCTPSCDGIIYIGALKHDELPLYLNSADVFVLPTLKEGCSNAIVEALACGLPIISSKLPFNDDILNDENSIRVDPNSVDEIAKAILAIKNDKLRRKSMSLAAINMATSLSLEQRVDKIIMFIKQKEK